jgi:hypothetical protein
LLEESVLRLLVLLVVVQEALLKIDSCSRNR